MRKQLLIMLVLVGLIASCNITKAQTTCDSAVVLTPSLACNYYVQQVTPGSTEMWYKFVASSDSVTVNTMQYGMPPAMQPMISLFGYMGNCGSLTQLNQHYVNLGIGNLTIGNTYYIRVYQPNMTDFGICVRSVLCLLQDAVISITPNPICPLQQCTLIDNSDYCPNSYCVWDLSALGLPNIVDTWPNVLQTHYINSPSTPGIYPIIFCIYWDNGSLADCETLYLEVIDIPTTSFTFSPTSPSCTNTFCFVDQSTYVYWDQMNPPLGWNFGDGGTGSTNPGNTICYTYSSPGTYTVTLIATNQCGSATSTATIEILEPNALFSYDTVCVGDPTHFTDLSICPDFWYWDFGDGTSSNLQNPVHHYSTSGNYTVTLTINTGGTHYTQNVFVSPYPDAPIITGHNNNCDINETYIITNFNTGNGNTYMYGVNALPWINLLSNTFHVDWNTVPGGMIYVQVTNQYGCTTIDSMKVFDCCEHPGSFHVYHDEIYTGGNLTNQTFTINGILTINSNVTWAGDDIFFGTNAQIKIMPGATLTIMGSGTTGGCSGKKSILLPCGEYMWDGIFALGETAKLTFVGSIAEGAKNVAVLLNGAQFTSFCSTFRNNFQGVRAVWLWYSSPNYANFTIYNDSIYCNQTLLPQYPPVVGSRTKYGIDIVNVNKIVIGKVGNNNKNYFQNMDVGINCYNSYVSVYNNQFSNIQTPFPLAPISNYGAIYSTTSAAATNTGLIVGDEGLTHNKHNYFYNCTFGVYSFNNRTVKINKNVFDYTNNQYLRGTAIYLSELVHFNVIKTVNQNIISNYRYGIWASNIVKASINANNITNVVSPSTNPWLNARSYGIRVTGGSSVAAMNNNIVNSSNTDWRIEGVSYDISPSAKIGCNHVENVGTAIFCGGGMFPSNVFKNDMLSCSTGFFLNWGIIGTQGDSAHPQDNKWLGTFTNCQTMSYNSDGFLSPFFARTGSVYWPTTNCVDNSGYINATAIPFLSASGSPMMCPIIHPIQAIIQQQQQIAQGLINFPVFNNENKWMGKQGLYKHLLLEDTTSTDSVLVQFKAQANNGSLGKFESVNNYLTLADSASAAQYTNIINPIDIPEATAKTIYTIYLNPMNSFGKHVKVCNNDLTTLQNIASQCPYQYGNAVYQARMLLAFVDTTEYYNICEFSDNNINNQKTTYQNTTDANDNKEFSVFPNPANDQLTVLNTSVSNAIIEIYNYIGEKIISCELKNYSSFIAVKDLNAGIYFYKITVNNELVKTDKIVVIK